MKTELKFGMLHTVYTGESIIEEIKHMRVDEDGNEYEEIEQIEKHGIVVCSDPKCGRFIQHDEPCFVDTMTENGNVYCDSCGKCIRYERKRAKMRENKQTVLSS